MLKKFKDSRDKKKCEKLQAKIELQQGEIARHLTTINQMSIRYQDLQKQMDAFRYAQTSTIDVFLKAFDREKNEFVEYNQQFKQIWIEEFTRVTNNIADIFDRLTLVENKIATLEISPKKYKIRE